jgi:polyisoprenoid-binding protein YceI
MISDVKGAFSKVAGEIEYDEKNPQASKVDATIEMGSIDTREPHRDEHLKTAPDFLDVAKYPTMTFKSKKVITASKGHLQVIGDLNLHGVTKEVTLDVDGPTEAINDGHGGQRRGASATTKINRKDFGVTWNKALDNGGVTVGDEVNITIDLEMKKPKVKA